MLRLSVPRGTRGILIGQSGSGKTTLALALADTMPPPLLVVDTKWSKGIGDWAKSRDVEIVHEFPSLKKLRKGDDFAVVWRPEPDLLGEPMALDAHLDDLVRSRETCSVYIDELYQLHRAGRAGPGLIGLYTRGREMGFTTLAGSQRPAWVSAFCLTESDQYYIMRLLMRDDRKKVGEMMGAPQIADEILPEHWFWHAKQGAEPVLIRPLKVEQKMLDNDAESVIQGDNGYFLV